MGIQIFDRIIIIKETPGSLPVGTVATCRQFINERYILAQYDFKENEPQYVGLSVDNIRLATPKDLDAVDDYRKLIPKIYHIGSQFLIRQNYPDSHAGKIIGIRLAINEMEDLISINFPTKNVSHCRTSSTFEFTRKNLDDIGSYIPFDIPEEVSIAESNELAENTPEDMECEDYYPDDIVKIVVNNMEFSLIDNNLIIPSVDLKDIDKVITSLNKLNKLLRKE